MNTPTFKENIIGEGEHEASAALALLIALLSALEGGAHVE